MFKIYFNKKFGMFCQIKLITATESEVAVHGQVIPIDLMPNSSHISVWVEVHHPIKILVDVTPESYSPSGSVFTDWIRRVQQTPSHGHKHVVVEHPNVFQPDTSIEHVHRLINQFIERLSHVCGNMDFHVVDVTLLGINTPKNYQGK